jgi:hypothetical protein
MGTTRNTGYLQNIVQYDASNNITLPANLTVTGSIVGYATTSYVTTQINNLINGAPGLLDTLDELAAALGDDANFAATLTTSLSGKQASLSGTGFVKISGTTISYDNSTYLTTASATSTYLPLAGGTLTGNLGIGNTASYLLDVYAVSSGSTSTMFRLKNGYNDPSTGLRMRWDFASLPGAYLDIITDSSGHKSMYLSLSSANAAPTQVFQILGGSGAASFSSTVAATGLTIGTTGGSTINITTSNNAGISGTPLQTKLNFLGYNGNINGQIRVDDVSSTAQVGSMQFYTWNSGQVLALSLAHTGAATFTSSVSTGGDLNVNNGNVYAGVGGPAASRGFYTGNTGYQASFLYNNSTGNLDITPRAGYSTIFTAGNVGIGTATTPATLLDLRLAATDNVAGSVLSSYPIASFVINASGGGQRGLQIGGPTGGISSPVFLKVFGTGQRLAVVNESNVENFTVTSGGSVGIGTFDPGQRLEIKSPDGQGIRLKNSGSSDKRWDLVGSGNDFRINETGVSASLTIQAGGNVGIGLTNPQAILDVSHTAGTTNIIRVSNGAGNYRWRIDQNFTMAMTNAAGTDTFSVNTSGGLSASSLISSGFLKVHGITKTFAVTKNVGERLSNSNYFSVSSSGGGFQVVVYTLAQNVGVGWSQSQVFQAVSAPYWGGWIGNSGSISTIGSGAGYISSAVVNNTGTITFRISTDDNGTNTTGTIQSYIQVTAFSIDNISVTVL